MLTQEDYWMIKELHERGMYRKDIADRIGVHLKTITRALKQSGVPSRRRPRMKSGYFGGAIVYHVARQKMWIIAGIITHFPTLRRPVYDENWKETGHFTKEHTGLVGYVPVSAVWQMIEDAVGE